MKEEFLRRMEQHNLSRLDGILPKRYVKIRHYGYLQNHGKKKRIDELKTQLNIKSKPIIKIPIELKMMERYQLDILKCTKCATGRYQLMEILHAGQCSDVMNEHAKWDVILLPNKAPPQCVAL